MNRQERRALAKQHGQAVLPPGKRIERLEVLVGQMLRDLVGKKVLEVELRSKSGLVQVIKPEDIQAWVHQFINYGEKDGTPSG